MKALMLGPVPIRPAITMSGVRGSLTGLQPPSVADPTQWL